MSIGPRLTLFLTVSIIVAGTGCSPAVEAAPEAAPEQNNREPVGSQSRSAIRAPVIAQHSEQPLAVIAQNFAAAILDGKRKTEISSTLPGVVKEGVGGIRCTPAMIASMARNLTIHLPKDLKARRNVFAVLTPQRGPYAIYYPYDLDEPAEDYIIPSDQISWQDANEKSDFTVQPQLFDGVKMEGGDRFQIFLENGYYQFALLRKSLPENADAIRSADNVIAACVVHYTGS